MSVPPIPEELWNQIPPAAQAAVLAVIATLESRITTLETRISELEARLNQNSSNSSRPPSSDPPYTKPTPPQAASSKRKGGQPGHPKRTPPTLPPDGVVELRADTCRHCGTPLAGDDPNPLVHQVIEIPPLRPVVTHYRRHRITCARCHRVNYAPLPAGVRGGYGVRVQATCALLCGAYRIGKRGAARLCGELFGVPISSASVCKLQHSTAQALQPIAQQIQAHVVGKPANVDETSWRQSAKRTWLWAAVSRWVSAFMIGPSRRRENIAALIPGELGVVTADRFGAYDHLKGATRQVCWAHLRRDFRAMIDRKDAGSGVGEELLACSDRMFGNWKRVRDGTLSREDFARDHLPILRSEVAELLWRGWACEGTQTRRVCGGIQRVESSLWAFASAEGVEPTNNAAERALRQGVCWRKTSYGTDSACGSRFAERILSVVESCRQQGRDLLAFLTCAIQAARTATPPPSLIPAGT
jgi:transposase